MNQFIKSVRDDIDENKDRMVEANEISGDNWQQTLRPKIFEDYIGQSELKQNLNIYVKAAKNRKEALDHVLLYGPPGLGKTTLAGIIANELGVNFRVTSGPAIERPGDLAALLTNLNEHDVLFIDEIHRLNRSVEEILYPAMEDFALDIIIGKGPGARSYHMPIAPFTLIGATTRAGSLAAPLRDRFGIIFRMKFYNPQELKQIIIRSANILQIKIETKGAEEIAKRSRGTPRIANRLLKRVRDFAQVLGTGVITADIAQKALSALHIDCLGLDVTDLEVIRTIITKFDGGPVGIDTIAASVSEEKSTIEDVYEPYLMKIGFLSRTPRGRIATKAAYKHLNISVDEDENSSDLFNKFYEDNENNYE